ncbi:NmrA family NAD(P)-binding protein [Altererythrobacter sp. BO-6]|uniref:SDR family oxidoreductase n=1 Tax=Altererythrobacter sp. BO-6 TaxID=2604537 RepID=UPI0013E2051B|nr:NAD(P)H-binding protein [Altererythrobacter sp. BO-6]QIG54768.1 NmrA family NAD(P)-binding protein [Altererythrobacter sp. BO-6]
MILIVGGSGRLGRAVANRLLEAGNKVRVSSRKPASLHDLTSLGAEAVRLDLRKPEEFVPALEGVSRVFTAAHALTGRRSDSIDAVDLVGHQKLIDAARRAGVEHFVYTSAQGARLDHPVHFWSAKAAVEAYLEKSGLRFTVLRPSAFMDLYAFELIGRPISQGKTVHLLGSGSRTRNLVAVSDIAELAVRVLTSEEFVDTHLEVRGPADFSDREIIDFYSSKMSRTARVRSVPQWALKPIAALMAPIHSGIANLLRLPTELAEAGDATIQHSKTITGGTTLSADPILRERI